MAICSALDGSGVDVRPARPHHRLRIGVRGDEEVGRWVTFFGWNGETKRRVVIWIAALCHTTVLPAEAGTHGGDREGDSFGYGRAQCRCVVNSHTVSNCSADRLRLEERFERWSISTPTTSFASL